MQAQAQKQNQVIPKEIKECVICGEEADYIYLGNNIRKAKPREYLCEEHAITNEGINKSRGLIGKYKILLKPIKEGENGNTRV